MPEPLAEGEMDDNQCLMIQLGWLRYKNIRLLEEMGENLRESCERLKWACPQGAGDSGEGLAQLFPRCGIVQQRARSVQ